MSTLVSAPRVAFQGEFGAFSEEALQAYFNRRAAAVPRREFRDVGAAVVAGEVEYGLLPIENTLAGSVVGSYDVLAAMELLVIGEVIRPIRHQLLGVPGAILDDVERAISHPVALAQCTSFFAAHPSLEAMAVYDTAGAAKEVAEKGDRAVAAIAARGAADRYGLTILAADIQDRSDNQTRFLVVTRPDASPMASRNGAGPQKTALIVETDNCPGALVEVLLPLARSGINLSKLESRPADVPWSYRFFLELEANTSGGSVQEALEQVRQKATALRVLGSFPGGSAP